MLSRRWAQSIALLLLLGMLVPAAFAVTGRSASRGPSSDDLAAQQQEAARARCVGYARSVADQIQTYVSQFGQGASKTDPAPPSVPSIPKLRSQVADLTARVGGEGCDTAVFRSALSQKLRNVHGQGPLGTAVADTLVANVRDVLVPGTPRDVRLGPDDDLARALARVPSGSTVHLAAGRYELSAPLVVLQDLDLRGAGRNRTRIASSAAEAAVLQAAPVTFAASDLTLTHVGKRAASVVVLRAGVTRLDHVTVAGARVRPASATRAPVSAVPDLTSGGNGIVVLGTGAVSVRAGLVRDNQAGGIVSSGRAEPVVSGTEVVGNGLCGVCFLGRSAGTVRSSTLRANGIGAIAANAAHPQVRDTRILDNQRAGVVSQDRARPVLVGNRIERNGDIGIAVYGRSAAQVRDNTVTGHREVGIVVSADDAARPQVTGNSLSGNTQAGLAFLGSSRGRAAGNRCGGTSPGVVLGGRASPDVSDETCPVRDERTG